MYCIDSSADEPIMMCDKHIGYNAEDGQGIDGAEWAKELLYLDTLGKKRIVVKINSPGGNVVSGMNMYNAILTSKTPVDTECIGLAASMGAALFMAGRKRTIADYAKLMIHNPGGSDDKNAVKALTDAVCTMTEAKCDLSAAQVGALMDKETWLSSAECLQHGFATDIAVTSERNKKYMPAAGARAMWAAANEIVNNAYKTENDMKKITAYFKLNSDASEDSILEAAKAVESNATALKLAKEKAENDLVEAKNNVTAIEAKLKVAEEALALITAKANTDAEAALLEKSTAMVTAAAKVGRIANKPEVITSWAGLAVKDFDGTKKIIDELPLNVKAAAVEVTEISAPEAEKMKGSAAYIMHQINAKANKTAIV